MSAKKKTFSKKRVIVRKKAKAAPAKSSVPPRSVRAVAVVAVGGIQAWEDDPMSVTASVPVARPVPDQTLLPLKVNVTPAGPAAGNYQPGSVGFRYWNALDALTRCITFWSPLLPPGTKWFTGQTLPVNLAAGVDLNAYYDRTALSFFQDTVGGKPIFSGESPDVLCHEMGHAILDAIKPELFDANILEVAAFHESFGDMSSILTAFQLDSLCAAVISETSGKLNSSSRVSRLAEELGAAVHARNPSLAAPNFLRNAVNSFFYASPAGLPTAGPDSSINAEPHNFSRVFTGGFFDALVAMIAQVQNPPTAAGVKVAATDMAKLLVAGVRSAAITSNYFFQVASSMIAADAAAPNNGRYTKALQGAFVRRGILPLSALTTVATVPPVVPRAPLPAAVAALPAVAQPAGGVAAAAALKLDVAGFLGSILEEVPLEAAPLVNLPAQQFGFSEGTLLVESPAAHSTRMAITSMAPGVDNNGAELSRFISYLFQRGRVELDINSESKSYLGHARARKTHVVTAENGQMRLRRKCFDCGFD